MQQVDVDGWLDSIAALLQSVEERQALTAFRREASQAAKMEALNTRRLDLTAYQAAPLGGNDSLVPEGCRRVPVSKETLKKVWNAALKVWEWVTLIITVYELVCPQDPEPQPTPRPTPSPRPAPTPSTAS